MPGRVAQWRRSATCWFGWRGKNEECVLCCSYTDSGILEHGVKLSTIQVLEAVIKRQPLHDWIEEQMLSGQHYALELGYRFFVGTQGVNLGTTSSTQILNETADMLFTGRHHTDHSASM